MKMAKALFIQVLHDQGGSQRRIARVLSVSRESVAKYLREFKAAESAHRVGRFNTSHSAHRVSASARYDSRATINKLGHGLSTQRILQEMCDNYEFAVQILRHV